MKFAYITGFQFSLSKLSSNVKTISNAEGRILLVPAVLPYSWHKNHSYSSAQTFFNLKLFEFQTVKGNENIDINTNLKQRLTVHTITILYVEENGCPNFRHLFTTKFIKSHVKLPIKSYPQKVNSIADTLSSCKFQPPFQKQHPSASFAFGPATCSLTQKANVIW